MTSPVHGDHVDLLASIGGPGDIQALEENQLPVLAEQVRRLIIETVTATGGHLGSGLGTVELTIALHRVFSSPHDIMVFDTGHQTYPHKLLTGRANQFTTLRKADGLSGYPSRAESPHDWVENSHASVSLAWVDGIAKALALQGQHDRRVVAVIGDGALTGGAAWEGLNNLGGTNLPVIVVLNDNTRSYDPTAGAVGAHLHKLRRGTSTELNLFENLGFDYIGPVDGHDIEATCAALRQAASLTKPVVVHAVTAKGRGYPPAEADDNDRMHACGVVDAATGRPATPTQPGWTDVFEDELLQIAHGHPNVVALTAAMRIPTGLGAMSKQYPHPVFDSGIAEQHLLASAAGLALAGAHPVVALYSTFLNRGFDQLVLDVGLHELPVTLVLDRAGVTGPDGPSHHGIWDLGLLTCVPGLRIACPRDPARLRQQLRDAIGMTGPTALRYPKAKAGQPIYAIDCVDGIDILYADRRHQHDVLMVAVGPMAGPCIEAAEVLDAAGIGVTVVDPQWIWPLSPSLAALAIDHRVTVCVEDGIAESGFGAHFGHYIGRTGAPAHVHTLGLPSAYLAQGNRDNILAGHGLNSAAIAQACRSFLGSAHRTRDASRSVDHVRPQHVTANPDRVGHATARRYGNPASAGSSTVITTS